MIPSLGLLTISTSEDKLFISIFNEDSKIVNNVSAKLHCYIA